MPFNFVNLVQRTRDLMIEEVDYDVSRHSLYLSPRLNVQGSQQYENQLRTAIQTGYETTLAGNLHNNALLRQLEPKTRNAHEVLAEGEFNRFYIRALCRRVLEDGTGRLEIYRAKQVGNPRPTSQARIGQMIDPTQLLNDLRSNIGVDTALGLPPGPNSGLSVRIL